MREPGKFCRNLQEEESSAGPAGQDERNAPDGATKCGEALSGHGHSGRRPRRLHRGGARLSRDEQGREALLGDAVLQALILFKTEFAINFVF